MTPDEKEQLQALATALDTNENGTVDMGEVMAMINGAGGVELVQMMARAGSPSAEEIFKMFDANNDGEVTPEEAIAFFEE